ncbi:stage III sporulation protein AE [Paraclostridium sordellii]|uniref:stage III sporulation protein AE n=1 Tax=Paraclostridium sordellii TaxID=1505 RepID=UPI0005E6A9AA|nr:MULTISPECIES: stage III sporulation protein AE [Paeniclostridium]MBW4861965.1 stage III sporulation protein AE [Paeniclostridium sp.]MBW4873480.1 stage III sporulation protein AE [Paeniclostridium sp.]CEN84816.1 stage III sporulation protein AE [[Clostridium] sordellii] [Paeniclostridium sordellii]CEN94324.1 stage III sporulation protein AE [[Clostridium] sordellii] [Paeniclostridium sordellii]CEN96332.1 stage III sporulation protein AE [[Clostridium] sordellii] [Paeniclostridium sordellii]
MKKILISITMCILIGFTFTSISFANEEEIKDSVDSYITKQLNKINLEDIQKHIKEEDLLVDVDLKTFVKDLISGKKTMLDLFNKEGFKVFLFEELKASLKVASIIFVLALLSSILKSLDNSFSSGAVSQVTTYIVFIVMVTLTLVGFKDVLNICNNTIDSMINLMQIVMPILITFLVVMGFPITSTVMTPIFMGGVTFINIVFKNFLFISITIGFAVLVINNISSSIKLKKLSSFIKQINLITIGAIFTIYLGLVSMQGMYVKSLDGFAIKSTKFAIGNFIPVVGGFVSDSFDIILSSSQLIKNLFGGVGLIILIGICLIPIVKIISIILVYKASAMIVEPVGEENISNFLNEISNLMAIMLGCIIAITIMFFVTIAIVISISVVAQ